MGDWDVVSKEPLTASAAAADPWAVVGKAPIEPPAPDRTSWLERFGQGFVKDPGAAVGQQLGHAASAIGVFNPETADQRLTEREAAYQAERGPNAGKFDLARTIGQGVTSAVLGGRLGPTAAGALSGNLTPVTDPKEQKDFWTTKAEQTGVGGVAGKLMSNFGSNVAKAIKPTFDDAVQTLVDAGVKLTPGQLMQGSGKYMEQMAKKIPGLGYVIQKSIDDSTTSLNHAAVNETLKMAGGTLPKDVEAGIPAVTYAKQWFSKEYNQALSAIHGWQADAGFVAKARQEAKPIYDNMTDAGKKEFKTVYNNILTRLNQAGTLAADGYKAMMIDLRTEANPYLSSPVRDQQRIGEAMQKLQQVTRDTLDRQNPHAAPRLFELDKAYAAYSRVKDASNDAFKNGGIFTPNGLLNSIGKEATRTGSRDALGLGDKFMQQFAVAAKKVIPNTEPNSGTPTGMAFLHGMGALAEGNAAMAHPGIAAGIVGGMLPYTSIGKAAVNAWAKNGILGPVQAALDKIGTKTGVQFLNNAAASFPQISKMMANAAQQGTAALAPAAGALGAGAIPAATNALAPFINSSQQP